MIKRQEEAKDHLANMNKEVSGTIRLGATNFILFSSEDTVQSMM